jgi:hypothetical protein
MTNIHSLTFSHLFPAIVVAGLSLFGPVSCGSEQSAATCRLSSDCVSGEICLEGTCAAECREDRDCTGSAACVSGVCADGVPPTDVGSGDLETAEDASVVNPDVSTQPGDIRAPEDAITTPDVSPDNDTQDDSSESDTNEPATDTSDTSPPESDLPGGAEITEEEIASISAGGVGTCGATPSTRTQLSGVPWLSQVPPGNWNTTMNCGPASLLMVVGHQQRTSPGGNDLRTLNDWMASNIAGWRLNGYSGSATSTTQLADIASRYFRLQLQTSSRGTFQSLEEALRGGSPVIVTTTTQSSNNHPSTVMSASGYPHFMVVTGIDSQYVYLADPGRSQPLNGCGPDCQGRAYTLDSFCATWAAQGRPMVTVAPASSCGDGTCSATENWSTCAADCPAVECSGSSTEACEDCGSRTRTCDRSTGSWSTWGICSGTGVCSAGTTESCGSGGTRTCTSECSWGSCAGETIACTGPSSEACGNCGTRTRTCNSTTGTWSSWSGCSGAGECRPDTTQSCGSGGTQTCTASCSWGSCSGGYTVEANYTSSYSSAGSCTPATSRAIYRGRATSIAGNTATMEFQKCDAATLASGRLWWVAVVDASAEYPQESLIASTYAIRTSGTVSSTSSTLRLSGINIWPSESSLTSASCGDSKYLFLITDGTGLVGTRIWFQYRAVRFTKVCD